MARPTPDEIATANLLRIWNEQKERRRLTQEVAGKELGWTQGMVNHYLNGRTVLGPVATLKWAQYLKVRPSDIRPDFAFSDVLAGDLTPEALEIVATLESVSPETRQAILKLLESFRPA